MTTPNNSIFMSHIAEEKKMALLFKKLIEDSFLGLVEVFVSSDPKNIQAGQKWLSQVTAKLKTCSIEIVLCSPKSVSRPWINFEAGAGWIRDIPVIPICHSGMSLSDLPIPLSLLQAVYANEAHGVSTVLQAVANKIGATEPKVDLAPFITKVTTIEKELTFWKSANSAFEVLDSFHHELIHHLRTGATVEISLNDKQITDIMPYVKFLQDESILSFSRLDRMTLTGGGPTYPCKMTFLDKWPTVEGDPTFRYSATA